jgi:hypothetical protein
LRKKLSPIYGCAIERNDGRSLDNGNQFISCAKNTAQTWASNEISNCMCSNILNTRLACDLKLIAASFEACEKA